MTSSRFDESILSKAHEAVQKKYQNDALPAMKILLWENIRQRALSGLDARKIDEWKNKSISLDATVYENYRQYYNHPEAETNEPLVPLSEYETKSQDVYYKYSQTTLEDLIKGQKLGGSIKANPQLLRQPLDEQDGATIALDVFRGLSQEKQITILRSISSKLGYDIMEAANSSDIEKFRRVFSMYFGNQKLKGVIPNNGDVLVRQELAQALKEINQQLKPLGYTLGIDTGYRSLEQQKVIKENHARTFGQADANKLYADMGKSAHHTGGAIDMLLLDANGNGLNLRIGDNSPKTKELLYGENLLASGVTISPKDKEAIELRRLLFHIMTSNGFTPLITEYWHFGWGDRLSRYIESKKSGMTFPAQYGNK